MSWAAHDTEGWQEVEVEACKRYLTALNPELKRCLTSMPGGIHLGLVLETLQAEFPHQFQRLMEQVPSTYLWSAEADYHLSKIHLAR